MTKFFTLKNRETLKELLLEGYQPQKICKELNVSKSALYAEIQKGVTEEEYANRQYIKYIPVRAIETDIVNLMREDSLDKLKEYYGINKSKTIGK